MGRSLHFEILNTEEISDEEKRVIYSISLKYNSGKYENVWTCESFMLDPWAFHPNWKKVGDVGGWEPINERYAELEDAGLYRREIIEKMVDEELVLYKRDTIYKDKIAGFCKVGGNEYNSFLIYQALIEISRKTKAEIALQDDGEFLLADVIIKNGLVKIDIDRVKRRWQYWEKKGWLKEEGGDTGLTAKRQFQESLMEKYPEWTEPEHLCRTVKAEDFVKHPEYGAGQVMAGFHGEYYGLTDKDAEKESYEMCSLVKGMADNAGMTIDVAPKLRGLSRNRKKLHR